MQQESGRLVHQKNLGWVPTGYDLEDNPESDAAWEKIRQLFRQAFPEFSENDLEDYELPDWHYETRCLFVHLHDEAFLMHQFVGRIDKILEKSPEWIAKFECFDRKPSYLGMLMFWNDKIYYDTAFSKSGYLEVLTKSIPD